MNWFQRLRNLLRSLKLTMGERLRFTGGFPPSQYWDRYPNWENALDEEGLPDQDETTLRPSDVQDCITTDTTFTVGEVITGDGRRLRALLEVPYWGRLDGVTAFHSEQTVWYVFHSNVEKKWITCVANQLPKIVPVDDTSIFPLTIKSRLPREATGQPHHVIVHADGSAQQLG
jgi:hypothetical protein